MLEYQLAPEHIENQCREHQFPNGIALSIGSLEIQYGECSLPGVLQLGPSPEVGDLYVFHHVSLAMVCGLSAFEMTVVVLVLHDENAHYAIVEKVSCDSG